MRDQRDGCDFEKLVESTYLTNLFEALQDEMQSSFYDYDFILHSSHALRKSHFLEQDISRLGSAGRPKVVFFISDETASTPWQLSKQAAIVFKNMPPVRFSNPYPANIFPFPLGCHRKTRALPIIPIQERKYNVFFSGQLSNKRLRLYKQLAGLPRLPTLFLRLAKPVVKSRYLDLSERYPNSLISFTRSFANGTAVPTFDYARTIQNSKIVLCPSGVVNPETLRHWEAMRAGCIVISEPLPPSHYTTGSPIIFIKRWREADHIIKQLLSNPRRMEDIHRQTLDWYRNVCSERATAQYMHKRIAQSQVLQNA